jgi:hypothetical protein
MIIMRMKKYLITAAMAVAVSGALVSCHEDKITGSAVEQKIQAFEDLFVQAFGKPDPNHTWGFGNPIVVEEVVTRSVDVNGNEWDEIPKVTADEKQAIYEWVNMPKSQIPKDSYKEVSPINWPNFFVTHIWGKSDNINDENTHYKAYNKGDVFGSEHMDHLQISKSSDRLGIDGVPGSSDGGQSAINSNWDHANNFNAASNQDWEGSTKFENWGTKNFAYHCSTDSRYHDKWIIVDGYYITEDHRFAGRYYVCFDFIGRNPDAYTTFYDAKGQSHNVTGAYKTLEEAIGKTATDGTVVGADWRVDNIDNGNKIVDANEYYTDWIVRLVNAGGVYIPMVKVPSTTGGKTTRVIKSGEQVVQSGRVFCEDIVAAQYDLKDLDYNDVVFDAAIVHKYRKLISTYYDKDNKLIPSTPENPNPKIEYGNFGIDGQENGYDEYYAKVCLLAAGGTLPISIQIGQDNEIQFNGEIHNILGKKSSSIMINTLSKDERERVNMATVDYNPAVDLTHKVDGVTTDKFALDKKKVIDINRNIMLDVQYGNVATTIEKVYYNGQKDVVASAKFMVPLGTPWAKERVNISDAFPLFTQWVKDETDEYGIVNSPFWEEANRAAATNFYCDPNYDLAEIQGLDPAVWSKGNFINGTTYTVSEETTTQLPDINGISISEVDPQNPVFTIPDSQTETILYDFTMTTFGPGYLYDGNQVTVASNTPITTGSKIRIYGVSTEGWEVTFDDQTKSASNGGRYSTNGYIEFDVTSNIGKRLQITGKNFTITYITQVNSTLWSGETVFNDDWKETIVIDAGKFTNAKADDIIRVYIRNKASNYTSIFKHVDDWSDWTGFQNNKTDTDEYFQARIPSDGLNELKSKGLRFQGLGFTATKIVLIPGS